MKNFKVSTLWAAFTLFVFVVIFGSIMLLLNLTYALVEAGFLSEKKAEDGLVLPTVFFFVASGIISLVVYFIGKRFLKPIGVLSKALTETAKGNFTTRLNYDGMVQEINEMFINYNSMVQELGNIETLRSDFVVTVSHEFKTPLTSIDGYATILQNQELTGEERKEYAEKISESTKQLAKLSSNILMISNLENKEIITNQKEFLLDEQIRQAILNLEPLWEEKKLILNIELNPVRYYGSEELLMQVWLNLIGNAIKFTPKNGEITIVLREIPRGVQIKVADMGIGISEEEKKRVFDKFYQVDRSGYTEGNGLGLSLVKRIIHLCHGQIEVESELGVGTSFIVILPVSKH